MLTFCDVLHAPLLLLALPGTRQHSRIPPKNNNINSYLHEPSWNGISLWKCFMKKDKTRQSDAKTVLLLHDNHNTNSNQGKV